MRSSDASSARWLLWAFAVGAAAALAACDLSIPDAAPDGDATWADESVVTSEGGTPGSPAPIGPATDAAVAPTEDAGADDAAPPEPPPPEPPPPEPPPPEPPPPEPPPPEPPPPEPPAQGCGAAASEVGFVGARQLTVGGVLRSYQLYVPASYDGSRPYPIVLVFHGDGGTGLSIRNALKLEAASGGEALFVYPDGLGKTWHIDTRPALEADVAFVDAIADALATTYCTAPTRVFATGMSRGAYFVHQLACRSRTPLRAVVSHSGGGPFGVDAADWDGKGNLLCAHQVAALEVHGLADTAVPPSEGHKAREFWRVRNGCSTSTSAYASSLTSACVAYAGCSSREVWCGVEGLGHQLWSLAARVTWDYFAALP